MHFLKVLLHVHLLIPLFFLQLKDELLLLTIGIGAACSLYFILVFSLEVHPHIKRKKQYLNVFVSNLKLL
jgi:hypothetical protein